MESLTEIKARIDEGDVEAAIALTNNPNAYTDEPQYDDSIPAEETLETIQPQEEEVHEEVVEEDVRENPDELTESTPTEEDSLQVERERVDALERDYEEREARFKAEAKEREEGLLKQVEEARKAKEDPEKDYFFGEDSEETPADVETSNQTEVADTTEEDWKKEITEIKERQQAKELEDRSIREFTRFWESEKGKDLKPVGMDAEQTIKQLDLFYEKLMGYNKNDEKAVMRTLYDLRNPETSAVHKDKLAEGQIDIPEQYDKLFDNWTVRMFNDGVKLDQVTGKVVPFREGKLGSLEDAYYLMNKDELLFKAKMETFEQINSKMKQHSEAATTIAPSQTASFAESGRLMDKDYRSAVLTQMANAGVKPGMDDLSMIKDPDLRQKAEDLMKFMK